MALFEIGPVYRPSRDGSLPEEVLRLAIALTGPRAQLSWQVGDTTAMDFYDLKGALEELFAGLHIEDVRFEPDETTPYHPGKCAQIILGDNRLGTMGEMHPLVREHYDLPETPLIIAELDLQLILDTIPGRHTMKPVPAFPPVLEDIAVIVDENMPAERVLEIIEGAGGKMLVEVRLFDVYRGEQIEAGRKSLAYSLAYQAPDRTLTDKEAAKIRGRIIRRLEQELGAQLRS
jgi:phenylalanyl-tRNA synthetase beta chain